MANDAIRATLLVLLALASSSHVTAQTFNQKCSVAIAGPKMGDRVGADVLVQGRVMWTGQGSLWAFAHRQGLAIWWPQGGGPVPLDQNGAFEVLVSIGTPDDVGAEFEIVVQVVSPSDSKRLDTWFRRASETGVYAGIPLPPAVRECVEGRVTVVKSQ
jgi:hypothetical protein